MRSQMLVERHLSDTLMGLCAEMTLADIKVAHVVAASGMSRQTLYNHFDGMADLLCYTASRFLLDTQALGGLFEPARIVGGYRYARAHRQFYVQLDACDRAGYGSCRDKIVRWARKKAYAAYAPEGMLTPVRLRRMCQIDLFVTGAGEVFATWTSGGCALPIEVVAGAVIEMTPPFMREDAEGLEPADPRDYPR